MTTTTKTSTMQRLHVAPFDPWDIGLLSLSEAQQAELPEGARAPHGWFTLPPAVRAHVAGLAVVVLAEIGPRPDRRQRAESLLGCAWRGTFDPEAAAHGPDRDYAARFFVEDPAAREAWRHSHATLHRMQTTTGERHTGLLRHMLARLDGASGVLATLRARHTALGAIIESLERRFGQVGTAEAQ